VATPKKRRQKLTADDLYNRGSVPKEQIAACVAYEYRREVPECDDRNRVALKAREQLPRLRHKAIFDKHEDEPRDVQSNISLHRELCKDFGLWPEFPKKPWRQVALSKRKKYVFAMQKLQTIENLNPKVRLELVTRDDPWDLLAALMKGKLSEEKIGWFSISSGATKNKTKEAFSKLLDTIESRSPLFFSKNSGGRGEGMDAQFQLSAYRVAKTHRFINAAGYASSLGWDIKDCYTSSSSFTRAVKSAAKRIADMRKDYDRKMDWMKLLAASAKGLWP